MKLAACLGAEPFKHCAAAPTTLGFEDITAGSNGNPFSYNAFTFLAKNNNPFKIPGTYITDITIVNSTTQLPYIISFPAVASGTQAIESTFLQAANVFGDSLLSLDIRGDATIGPFIAVSGYVNTITDQIAGGATTGTVNGNSDTVKVTVVGTFNNVSQASCQSGISGPNGQFGTNGVLTGPPTPVPITFANATDTCMVDVLSFQTVNAFRKNNQDGSAATQMTIVFSLDDFVVCQANPMGLQGIQPP